MGVIRCNNPDVHHNEDRDPGDGNILCFVDRNLIYIQCSDHRCSRWTEIKITVPGINVNLSTASLSGRLMPRGSIFAADCIPIVLEDE